MNKVLVLGGNGFIGSHIVDILHNNGFSIKVFDRESGNSKDQRKGIDTVLGTFSDKLTLTEALVDVDAVIHTLSTSVPSSSIYSPIDDINGNLINTVNLLNLMLENNVKRILFISSGGAVYGIPKSIPIDEEHPTNPLNSYGIVKLSIEKYLLMYERLYGLDPIIIRASNAYGPRQGHIGVQGFIATLLFRMLKNEVITVYGNGDLVRDYLFVEDLAELCLKAVVSKEKGIFNGGSGIGFSLNEIVKIAAEIGGHNPVIQQAPGRLFDVKKNVLCIKKAEQALRWKPKTGIEEGIALHLDWLKGRLSEAK
jgi:UDP-glucose 4-epimerase